jgi:hypothetical protein
MQNSRNFFAFLFQGLQFFRSKLNLELQLHFLWLKAARTQLQTIAQMETRYYHRSRCNEY